MKNNKGFTLVELVTVVGIAVIAVAAICVGGWLWDYSISAIMAMTHRPDTFKLWMGCVLAVVPGVGQLCFPVAAIIWVASMFM